MKKSKEEFIIGELLECVEQPKSHATRGACLGLLIALDGYDWHMHAQVIGRPYCMTVVFPNKWALRADFVEGSNCLEVRFRNTGTGPLKYKATVTIREFLVAIRRLKDVRNRHLSDVEFTRWAGNVFGVLEDDDE